MFSKPTTSRFIATTDNEIESLKKNRIPESTQNKTKWAIQLFNLWHMEYKSRLDGSLKVLKDIDQMESFDLNICLQYFIVEVRKQNGEKYPSRTLKELVAAIQHYFNFTLKKQLSIFNDPEFLETREVLDASMKLSAEQGFNKPKKRASAISLESENELWDKGVFGQGNGRQVISTLIYFLGLNFSLRASKEHRALEFGSNSQISLEKDENGMERLKYIERTSKNRSFGIKSSTLEQKITYLYANNKDPKKCIVSLYKLYINLRPENNGLEGSSAFYLTPIDRPKTRCWYKNIPMGINTISKALGILMSPISASDGKFYSNTSLRRTAKTRMVESGVPRELAAKKTGHLSKADLTYLDTNNSEKEMCLALRGDVVKKNSITNFNAEQVNAFNDTSLDQMLSQVASKYDFKNAVFNNCTFHFGSN